jgi:2-polyprenyl-6-methoxyphenol hydroxylase-like FAD-dependent oxidoreductase
MLPDTANVLVVGAGPTGLALALSLTARGIPCTVVDAQAEGANTSRAAVVHARTLEVLAPLGVTDQLISEGIRATRFTIRDRDRVLMTIDFSALLTPYPYTLMIPQAMTEAILLQRLTDLGVKVRRPARVTGLRQAGEVVTVGLDDGTPLEASWVVGADGMASTIREAAGIAFTGDDYQESFLLADVALDGGRRRDEVILYFSPAGMVVLAPLPGGTYRVVATMNPAPERPQAADVQALLDQRGPRRPPARVEHVVWGSRFRVHHRVAERFRSGRVLLAGDAAHVHSPAGGQGMNTGIQDAIVLAQTLEAALGGDLTAMDAYERSRRPIAQNVVRTADRLTRLATMPAWRRPIRNTALSLAGAVPAVPHRLAQQLSGLKYR